MSYAVRERQSEGWLLFSAVILITNGIMRVIEALWAFDKDDEITDRLQVLLFDDDLTAYGWLWLAVGVLLIAAGFGVMSGAQWARWFGIVMASFAAISAMLWIYQFPIWSLLSVLVAVCVMYGLTTYGGPENIEPR
jgi:hypothetical protein